MSGLVLIAINVAIFLAAVAGIIFFSALTLRFAGQALNKNRDQKDRAMLGVYAALSAGAIVASSAGGFLGIALMLYATRPQ